QTVDAAGGDVLARWTHTLAGGSQTSLQTQFDSYRRDDFGVPEVQRTFDFDFQDHVGGSGRNDIVWVAGYRVYASSLTAAYRLSLWPPAQTGSLCSGVCHDPIWVADSISI